MKKPQIIMIWFLPIVVIGGLFYPILGYLVVAMMAFFLPLSFFRGRIWCSNLCPRGAFLDIVISKISPKKDLPVVFYKPYFRWSVFALFMAFLAYRIMLSGGSLMAVGAVFVLMCFITTIISIVIGLVARHRGWCAICPMGTLQDALHKMHRKEDKK